MVIIVTFSIKFFINTIVPEFFSTLMPTIFSYNILLRFKSTKELFVLIADPNALIPVSPIRLLPLKIFISWQLLRSKSFRVLLSSTKLASA